MPKLLELEPCRGASGFPSKVQMVQCRSMSFKPRYQTKGPEERTIVYSHLDCSQFLSFFCLFFSVLFILGAGSTHTGFPTFPTSRHHAKALKEDPESAEAPPDASSEAPPVNSVSAQYVESQGPGSTASEVVEAYNELVEFALLVSNEHAMFDVKEAHLAFRRQSSAPAIESGMPTLRRFIPPSDWDRIEKMFDIVTNLPPSDVQQRCTFRHPMLFRVPGESRSYLCSKQTSVYLAGEVVPDQPVHFWMNFSSFDASQIRRPREPELQGIWEE